MRGKLYSQRILDRWVDKPTKTLFGSGYAGLGNASQKQFKNGNNGILKTHTQMQRRRLKLPQSACENLANGFTRKLQK